MVAVGQGTNTIAYSADGSTWTGSTTGNAIFTSFGLGVAWNGIRFVAVGQGTNSIAYSNDGITWVGVTALTIFSVQGRGVAWNGTRWIADGNGTSPIAYSQDGITWYSAPVAATIFTTRGNGVASNPVVGTPIVDSQVVLNNSGYGLSSNLDVVAGGYNNPGYTNFSLDCQYTTS